MLWKQASLYIFPKIFPPISLWSFIVQAPGFLTTRRWAAATGRILRCGPKFRRSSKTQGSSGRTFELRHRHLQLQAPFYNSKGHKFPKITTKCYKPPSHTVAGRDATAHSVLKCHPIAPSDARHTPRHTASHSITTHHTVSQHVTQRHTVSHYVTQLRKANCNVTKHHTMQQNITRRHNRHTMTKSHVGIILTSIWQTVNFLSKKK